MRKLVLYFLLGFCLFSVIGWWKGRHDVTSNLGQAQVKRVILENLEVRRVKSADAFFITYSCDGKPLYGIELDAHQLVSFEKLAPSDSVFRPALIVPASAVGLWALGSASGFSLIEKGKLLYSESLVESPSWRTLSFVAGSITGYTAGYWLGTRSHPKCLSAEVINALEDFDTRTAIQNDVCRSLLLDMFVVVDDDTKNPMPLVPAVEVIDAYSAKHPAADFNDLAAGFHFIYPLLLESMEKKDWRSNNRSFQMAAGVREKIEKLFKSPSPQLREAFGAQKSLRMTATYELIHDVHFIEAYRSRRKS